MGQRLSESPAALTQMQLECLRQAASTDKEIARRLAIAPETVSSHIRAAMRRLGASNRREAMGLLTVHPLYASIEIPNVQIVMPPAVALQASPDPTTPTARPRIIGRLFWVIGVFVGLTGLTIIGLSLLFMATHLISRQAPFGTL
jgi:DNA-binding CsgD family transcriptional regulator